jgi:SAM-dependent methyltransferase
MRYAIDDSGMPLRLGSALRVPAYAYPDWGIPKGRHRKESDAAYFVEWEGGSERQMGYVIESTKRAKLQNFPQILRDANSKVVAAAVRMTPGRVYIVEPGFGGSTITLFDELGPDEKDRVFLVGIEPSAKRCEENAEKLEKKGLRRGINFNVYTDVDTNMLRYVSPGSQHIIRGVATDHHHAYNDAPLRVKHKALRPGGLLISSDWHNSMWEHPNRVYRFLKTLKWDSRERDLGAFASMFPKALETAPVLGALDEKANGQIRTFWKGGWKAVRQEAIGKGAFDGNDEIYMLEGHRPVERCVEDMVTAGFLVDDGFLRELYREAGSRQNPEQHLNDSRLLMTLAGRKRH